MDKFQKNDVKCAEGLDTDLFLLRGWVKEVEGLVVKSEFWEGGERDEIVVEDLDAMAEEGFCVRVVQAPDKGHASDELVCSCSDEKLGA